MPSINRGKNKLRWHQAGLKESSHIRGGIYTTAPRLASQISSGGRAGRKTPTPETRRRPKTQWFDTSGRIWQCLEIRDLPLANMIAQAGTSPVELRASLGLAWGAKTAYSGRHSGESRWDVAGLSMTQDMYKRLLTSSLPSFKIRKLTDANSEPRLALKTSHQPFRVLANLSVCHPVHGRNFPASTTINRDNARLDLLPSGRRHLHLR